MLLEVSFIHLVRPLGLFLAKKQNQNIWNLNECNCKIISGGEGEINASLPLAPHAQSKLLRVRFVVELVLRTTEFSSPPSRIKKRPSRSFHDSGGEGEIRTPAPSCPDLTI